VGQQQAGALALAGAVTQSIAATAKPSLDFMKPPAEMPLSQMATSVFCTGISQGGGVFK
jgi:hypothetical protein